MVKAEISYEQIRKAIKKLSIKQRVKLTKELERQTWEERFKEIFTRVNAKAKKDPDPVSDDELKRIVDNVRQGIYERSL